MGQGDHSETLLLLERFNQSIPSCFMGGGGGGCLLILESAKVLWGLTFDSETSD